MLLIPLELQKLKIDDLIDQQFACEKQNTISYL